MIEVESLAKLYGDKKVLHELDFVVDKGKVCGFLGPNGSGKSTTMDIICGLLGPSAGTVRVCGFNVVHNAREVKRHIGYLPDTPPLYTEMTVQDFVSYIGSLKGLRGEERKKAVNRVIDECDVGDVRKRIIAHLSKGYKQRVALCAALVHKPDILLLDEPTEGLDPSQIVHIRQLITKLAKERTVLLCSHVLSEVQATCGQVVIIHNGHILAKAEIDSEQFKVSYFIYRFATKGEDALHWFQKKNFVKSASRFKQQENVIRVEYGNEFLDEEKENNLATVIKQLVQQNFPIVGIEEKKETLEELYFDVIRSQAGFHETKRILKKDHH